jgi:uncharacterized protein involved in response to NO
MGTQKEHPGSGFKARMVGIARKPVRPIFLSVAVLSVLATILGVIAAAG